MPGPALLPALLLLLGPTAAAAPRYDVELIVFERGDGGLTDEHWAPRVVAPRLGERIRASDAARPAPTSGIASDDVGVVADDRDEATTAAADDDAASRPAFGAGGYVDPDHFPPGFEPLGPGERRLAGAVRRLEQDPGYRVLRHLAWRQPALAPGEAVPVRIRTGAPMRVEAPAHLIGRPRVPGLDGGVWAHRGDDTQDGDAGDSAETIAAPDTSADRSDGQPGPAGVARSAGPADGSAGGDTGVSVDTPLGTRAVPRRWRTVSVHPLDGTVGLVVSRYLHIHADLFYTTPVTWERTAHGDRERKGEDGADRDDRNTALARNLDGRAIVTLPLRQQRRMRSEELHYLDHPALGLLVQVTPHEPPSGDGAGTGPDAAADAPESAPQ